MAFTSCDDFLTVSSPRQADTGNFLRDQRCRSSPASAYAQLYHGDSYATSEVRWPVEAYRTDLYDVGNDANNYQTWTDIYNFTYTTEIHSSLITTKTFTGYQLHQSGIGVRTQNPQQKTSPKPNAERLLPRLIFLRGYFHMMLLLNWGENYPARHLHFRCSRPEQAIERPGVACWELVISELSQATALPATRPGSELGRATSGAANAYTGFAYLTRAYEEPANESAHLTAALKALNEVQGYELVDSDKMLQMFNGKNKNCRNRSSSCNILPTLTMAPATTHTYTVSLPALEIGGWDEILPSARRWKSTRKKAERHRTGCTTNVFIIRFTSRMTTSTTLITAN